MFQDEYALFLQQRVHVQCMQANKAMAGRSRVSNITDKDFGGRIDSFPGGSGVWDKFMGQGKKWAVT